MCFVYFVFRLWLGRRCIVLTLVFIHRVQWETRGISLKFRGSRFQRPGSLFFTVSNGKRGGCRWNSGGVVFNVRGVGFFNASPTDEMWVPLFICCSIYLQKMYSARKAATIRLCFWLLDPRLWCSSFIKHFDTLSHISCLRRLKTKTWIFRAIFHLYLGLNTRNTKT